MPRLVLISVLVALAVAGCGRKGALEAPGATVTAPPATNDPATAAPADAGATPKPDRPFFLDKLI